MCVWVCVCACVRENCEIPEVLVTSQSVNPYIYIYLTQLFFKSGADTYATIDKLKNTVGPREKPVGLGEGAAGPREEAVTAAGSSALTQRDSEEAADPAPDRQVADCDVLYTTVNWKKKS